MAFQSLTPELFQEIFPIARSDRRKNFDIFKSYTSEEGIKDDAHFYPMLLNLIESDDLSLFSKYDRRMNELDCENKTFAYRAGRWLAGRSGGTLNNRQVRKLSDDHYPEESPEHTVLRLHLGLTKRPETTNAANTELEDEEYISEPRTWQILVSELIEGARALEHPDPDAAGRLKELAEALVEACRGAAAREVERRAREARLEGALRRLNSLGLELPDDWQDETDGDRLQHLEGALECAEAAHRHQTEASDVAAGARTRLGEAVGAGAAPNQLLLWVEEVARAESELQVAQTDLEASFRALEAILRSKEGEDRPIDLPDLPDLPNCDEPATSAEYASEVPIVSATEATAEEGEVSGLTQSPTNHFDDGSWPDVSGEEPSSPSTPLGNTTGIENAVQEIDVSAIVAQEDAPQTDPSSDALQPAQPRAPVSRELIAALYNHLAAGEVVFAWNLARLSEPAIPAPILRSLAILSAIQKAEDMADPMRSGALAEAAAVLPDAADQEAAAQLFLAALLRPALFDPDNGARGHMESLLDHPGVEAYGPLISALASLEFDVRLSTSILAELAGVRPAAKEPAARKRLEEWLPEALRRRAVHQPTTALFRELLDEGEIGRTIKAVLSETQDAESLARDLTGRLADNRSAQEACVGEAERRSGRPRGHNITGMALDWFCRGIQDACEHLTDWLEARDLDRTRTKDNTRERLLRALGPVRNALFACLDKHTNSSSDFVGHARGVLHAHLDDLRCLLMGTAAISGTPKPQDILDLPLLRLPGGCQSWSREGDPDFAPETALRDKKLTAALLRPECIAADEDSAFTARLEDNAILAAHRLLRGMRDRGIDAAEIAGRQQHFKETLDASQRTARERVARLRQSLTTIGYLDLAIETSVPGDLTRLSAIDDALRAAPSSDAHTLPALNGVRRADIPPDFPELDVLLTEMEDRRDALTARVSARQRSELERLTLEDGSNSARALLGSFERLDPVTVDDAIAEIKAGREVPLPEAAAPDTFTRFFHTFVSAMAASREEGSRGKILAALRSRGSIGPIDFSSIDERRAQQLHKLLEVWGEAENSLSKVQSPRLRDSLAKLFGQIGFTGVRLVEGREALPGRMRLHTMNCDVPRRANGFLPPVFGSASGGRFRLLTAHGDLSIDQILRQIGSEAPDAAWIIVLLGRLDVKDRVRLARQTRTEGRTALVLDETLLVFSGIESDDALATLLDCSVPFAWVQPYTTSPGQIPPEIFFGRQAEIDQIVARGGGGCLIYGGRQLGKSVLLNHIRVERHRPDLGELALYLDIKPIGGPGEPSDAIWQSFAHELGRNQSFGRATHHARDLVVKIEEWLDQDPSRRVLVMFDEADNFLRAEHNLGYPNLMLLKGLMERTGQRFKPVFAGLHNVRRMAQAPNSPLPHLGAPICIGPMNHSPENRTALRRLAVEPMRAAGLDYSDPGLASDMLARMNYYPSLVQVFGRQIVESFGRQVRSGTEGPRWLLCREDLFEGAAAEQIAAQIRDRFQLTLNLDIRYDCIARSIALHRMESQRGDAEVLSRGLTAAEIQEKTIWPRALAHHTKADFEELLKELVDLGILSSFPNDRYGLRNAQVAQMLGNHETLLDALLALDEREDDPSYDAAQYYRSLRPEMPKARSPLSDRDLSRLFDTSVAGIRLVRSNPVVAGENPAGRILAAAKNWLPGGDHFLTRADDSQLRRSLDKIKSHPAVLVIEGSWSEETAALLSKYPKVANGEALVVWVTPQWIVPGEQIPTFDTGPWSESMLRHWLADEGLAPALDDLKTRKMLLEVSGGLPARLEALRPSLTDMSTMSVSTRIAELKNGPHNAMISPQSLGLDSGDLDCVRALRAFADESTLEEIRTICHNASDERLEKLTHLGVIRQGRDPEDAPILTPFGGLVAS